MANRWWIYQQERFPVLKSTVLAAVLAGSAVGYSVLLRDRLYTQSFQQVWGALLLAFITVFLLFLQLRIANELRDERKDARYHPYRPVPRGLIQLWELGFVAVGCGGIQAIATYFLARPLLPFLVPLWIYLGLLSRGFFAERWLKSHPLINLLVSGLNLALFALFAAACDWGFTSGFATGFSNGFGELTALPLKWSWGLAGFIAMSFLGGIGLSLGRKIHGLRTEEAIEEAYLTHWTNRRSVSLWLVVVWLLGSMGLVAAISVQVVLPMVVALLFLLSASVLLVWQFSDKPVTRWAERFSLLSELWMVGMYACVGLLPMVWRG
jgi:UbiA prenyltransferase family